MSNAKNIHEKLKQRGEDAQAIKAYWEAVLPGIGNLPESQLQGWLNRFDLDVIVAGLDAAVIKRSKLDAKGEKLGVQEAVDYASGAMREAHFESLSEEERAALAAKAEKISAKRSAAGKLGNEKRWHSKPEVATASDNLRQDAMPLRTGYGFGGGGAFASACASADAFDSDHATKPAAATPPRRNEEKSNGNTNSSTNPKNQNLVRLADANQNPIEPAKTEDNTKTRNPKQVRRCKRCGMKLYRRVNHECPADTPEPVAKGFSGFSESDVDDDFYPTCSDCKCKLAPGYKLLEGRCGICASRKVAKQREQAQTQATRGAA